MEYLYCYAKIVHDAQGCICGPGDIGRTYWNIQKARHY